MDREKITLTGTQETMLATLYGKALESRSPNYILDDREAVVPDVIELRRLHVGPLRRLGRGLRYHRGRENNE